MRVIPITTTVAIIFGGIGQQAGWIMSFIGLSILSSMQPRLDLSTLYLLGPTKSATGKVTESDETNFEVNESSVYEIWYVYNVDGQEYEDVAYRTGSGMQAGAAVSVQYVASKPQYGKIKGLRRTAAPWPLLLIFGLGVPIGGLVLALRGLRRGANAYRLLSEGTMTRAKLASKKATNAEMNEQTVMKMTFVYTDQQGREHRIVEETHQPDVLEDEDDGERVLYAPYAPAQGMLIDRMPGLPKMDENERIHRRPAVAAMVRLLMPMLTVLGYGSYYLTAFLRGIMS